MNGDKGRQSLTSYRFHTFLFLFLFLVSLPQLVLAQQKVPESARAGVVTESLESPEVSLQTQRNIPVIEIKLPKEELEFPEGAEVYISQINIEGNTVIDTDVLKAKVTPFEERTLKFGDLVAATDAITEVYVEEGYFLSKGFLPVQEIKDGVLTIQVVEGKVGSIEVSGNKYYKSDFIKKHVKATKNGVIHHGKLLKSLILLNEFPQLNVRLVLARGDAPETANLILIVQDRWAIAATWDYNNFGSRFVTRKRTGLQLAYNNFLIQGDQLNLRGVVGMPFSSLQFGQIEYAIPVNGYGTRIGGSVSTTDFRATREFKQFSVEGEADIYNFNAKHPFLRNRTVSIDGQVDFDIKQIVNRQDPNILNKDYLRVLRESVTADWVDKWQGRNVATGSFSTGLGIFNAIPQNYGNASRPGSGGEFTKMNLNFSRVQRLPWSSFLLARTAWQVSWDQLPSSEQISLGGANSVRGYPQSSFLGDWGFTFNIELYIPPPLIKAWKVPYINKRMDEIMQVVFFYDHGSAWLSKYLFDEEAPNHQTFQGLGPGMRFNLPYGVNVRMDWGFPIGGPSTNDVTDGEFYLQVSKSLTDELHWLESLFRK